MPQIEGFVNVKEGEFDSPLLPNLTSGFPIVAWSMDLGERGGLRREDGS